jgi:NAD(P)H-dependent flavin oxidoreductase YrpB (nitropropane dioxygenase family)
MLAASCSTAEPGAAAVVGDTRIPESEIADWVRELNEATDQPPTQPNAQVTRSLVNYNVLYEVVGQAAAAQNVSVPPGAVDKAFDDIVQNAGGEERLEQVATQQGIPPSNIRRDIETQLLAGSLANKVAPGVPREQQQQQLLESLGAFSEEIGVEVSPKYGSWDPAALQIGPPKDPVSRVEEEPLPNGITELPGQ